MHAGDALLAINAQPLRDLIDYQYFSADEALTLTLERDGQTFTVDIQRTYGAELGITFADVVFDGMRMCRNRCPFCFVDQMPRGLRKSLYLHDDDYRYSFLLGNYVTLTNLRAEDWQRIRDQHLTPLYLSVHAADLEVRRRMLGNPRAEDVVEQIHHLAEIGVSVHAQVVICPGVNDGAVLSDTITRMADLFPCVQSLALVPVGLTSYARPGLTGVTPEGAREILREVRAWHRRLREPFGCTWLYPSDELYLLADKRVPAAYFYDDDSQWQNGVGMLRWLLDDWASAKRRGLGVSRYRKITLASGALIVPTLARLAKELAARMQCMVQVVAVPNRLFGESVTVAGLLSAEDVRSALAGSDLGQALFLPDVMFSQDDLTLDDQRLEDISKALGIPVFRAAAFSDIVRQISVAARP